MGNYNINMSSIIAFNLGSCYVMFINFNICNVSTSDANSYLKNWVWVKVA